MMQGISLVKGFWKLWSDWSHLAGWLLISGVNHGHSPTPSHTRNPSSPEEPVGDLCAICLREILPCQDVHCGLVAVALVSLVLHSTLLMIHGFQAWQVLWQPMESEYEAKYVVQVCSLGPSLHVEGFRFPCKTIRCPAKIDKHNPCARFWGWFCTETVAYFSRYIHF